MRINTRSAATLLAAGAIAAGIAAAPAAAAAIPGEGTACSSATPGTACETPGNAQLNDSLQPNFESQWPSFMLYSGGRIGGGHR